MGGRRSATTARSRLPTTYGRCTEARASPATCRSRKARDADLAGFGEQPLQVEGSGDHGESVVRLARPGLFRPVPVELDAVPVGVAEVDRLAHAVIGSAVDAYAGVEDAAQRARERRSGRKADGEVVEARRAWRRRR